MDDPRPVALGVVLRQTHVPLLVDRVVELLVGDGRNSDTHLIEIGEPEHRVQRVRAAAAPSPHADAIGIDECVPCRKSPDRGGLVFRRQISHRSVNDLSPFGTLRSRSAAIVERHDDVTGFGKSPMEEHAAPADPTPPVEHGLIRGLTVDEYDDGILARRIKVGRLHDPAIEHNPSRRYRRA